MASQDLTSPWLDQFVTAAGSPANALLFVAVEVSPDLGTAVSELVEAVGTALSFFEFTGDEWDETISKIGRNLCLIKDRLNTDQAAAKAKIAEIILRKR